MGIMIRNEARLVSQGYTQEEEIDYDEVFAPVTRIEAIRVYKVEKALYGLHQASRAWYETLLTYLLDNEFQRGKIDKTIFIKRDKDQVNAKVSHLYAVKRIFRYLNSGPTESVTDEAVHKELGDSLGRRIDAIDQDEDITLVNVQDDAEMFDVNDLGGKDVFVAEQEVVSTTATTVTTEEITLAQALEALKTSKPKRTGLIFKSH
uniref:Reverse transcriptase Ty1/copia-type domain-containing protein n=1 Tax=Tanacetum cinerariifolium TaxID=118510 RepID=A0A699HEH8_TANCI|nr:hypothetical protein [Tanacetum cinerariifolium]